ncbi:hypothetical protein Sango_0007300 [Sesamum angolense]|uniref:Retrotransposon gag domain-containing protein n=1 Tax=Sesamum angolense TaxID=2727404 RepID=A0AAE1XCN0_9LAMI|nr:hypothetical protein Sango_0007300 [Sesamum angolense]
MPHKCTLLKSVAAVAYCVAISVVRCASVDGCSIVVLLSNESSHLLWTANHKVPLPSHCGRRLVRSDTESPRHAASPSERVANLEDENSRLTELVMNLEENVSSLETDITVLNSELDEYRQVVQEMASAFGGGGIADMRRGMEQMLISIGLLQRAVSNVPIIAHDPGARLRIPKQKAYDEDEARKVSTATMYLTGDAKLWWRTKYAEIQANQVRMDTWALLREAIREQFFPENIEYNARRALWKLDHTCSVRDYVKAFSALMLDIRDMSEKDKLFTFMEGPKPWARLEL